MFCIHCGTEASANDRFCRSCGRELTRNEAAPTGDSAASAPTSGSPSDRAEPTPIGAGGRAGPTWSGQPVPPTPPPAWSGASTIPRNPANAIPEFASVGRRIGAFFIDLGFTAVGFVGVAIVIGFIFGIVIAVSDGFPEDDGGISTSQEEALGYIVFGVWAGALFIGTWIANAMGGSIGKRILGLRIVDEQLQAPGWGTGLGRTLAAWLSWLAVGLGFLWATWDERQQTWHDKMAATFVVRDDSLPDRPNPRLLVPRPPGPGAGPGSLH